MESKRVYSYGALLLHFLIVCFLSEKTSAQNYIGTPDVWNYSKQTYNAANHNRAIVQDQQGVMYFANGEGLLVFDGIYWRLFKMPNMTSIRSVAIDNAGRLYVGGQGEMGYFSAASNGVLKYHSLMSLVDSSERTFSDIWSCNIQGRHIFFRAKDRVYEYNGKGFQIYKGSNWSYVGLVGKNMVGYDAKFGFVVLENGNIRSLFPANALPQYAEVRTVTELPDNALLITTIKEGAYVFRNGQLVPFHSPALDFLLEKSIYSTTKINSGKIVVGTRLGGCYIMDAGAQQISYSVTKVDGLQSNNVLSIKEDNRGNLWLGLDNGIDMISYKDAFRHIYPEKENRTAGYTSVVFDSRLYFGTSLGLFSTPINNEKNYAYIRNKIEPVKNADGETRKISVLDGHLLLANSTGAYEVNASSNMAEPIDKSTGYWCFQPYKDDNRDMVVAGTYVGVRLLEPQNGKWLDSIQKLDFESSRFIEVHNGKVWIAHPYRGLFTLQRNSTGQYAVIPYLDRQKIISQNHNKLFKVFGRLVLANQNGIFEYSDAKQDFIRSDFFTHLFGARLITHLYEDHYGNIWFTSEKQIGVVSKTSNYKTFTYFPELKNKFTLSFENINVVDSSNVLIGAENGFIHLDLNAYSQAQRVPKLFLRNVQTNIGERDSVLFGGFGQIGASPRIPYSKNGITFRFSAIEYSHPYNIEYRILLKGFDADWSEWTTRSEKEFLNLPPGRYTFQVMCRNGSNSISDLVTYDFVVLPPWYQTWWAYILYGFAILALLYWLLKLQQKRYHKQRLESLRLQKIEYDRQQQKLEMEHRLEVQENEKKIVELTNEKLISELDYKNQELASSAMTLMQNVEVLSALKDQLAQYKTEPDVQKSGKAFVKIMKRIDQEIEQPKDWERFAQHFDKVHNNFLQSLKTHFPNITSNELKLSAYLKLNISTKEIAQLLNISVRGVETARLRLRKKLSLSPETNLVDFLLSFPDKYTPKY